tara:strand:+ start:315 stop:1196 length:882 start_codon:yes stop_codon:yes gene_type:complete
VVNRVIGRFAPSPTGPLHFGSLLAAISSYASAKHQGGLWRLRIDTIDPPREQAGAADSFISTLEAHGLHWDGDIVWQHQRIARYREVLAELIAKNLVYACDCSRSARAEAGVLDCLGPCRHGEHHPNASDAAWRLRSPATASTYHDRLHGELSELLSRSCGDAILWRRDDLPAYQLATVVDDHDMSISEVVRGTDLLDNTARQCHLADSLGWARPQFLHIPMLINSTGQKLSKQSHALALNNNHAAENVFLALQLLAQQPPAELRQAFIDEIITWAVAHWSESALPIGDIKQP